jgi:hypothetical protein
MSGSLTCGFAVASYGWPPRLARDRSSIDAAMRYREAYADEIEARIALHRHDTAAADA